MSHPSIYPHLRLSNSSKTDFQRSTFICSKCGAVFPASADEYLHEDGEVFVKCLCGEKAPEAWFMKNLRAGTDKKTGPTSPKGKQRASRNAITHGQYSTSYLHPRKPGDYPECENCQDKAECESDRSGYCHRRAEIYNKFFLAVKSGDPDKIRDIAAANFAASQQLLNYLMHDVHAHGTLLEGPVLGRDEDGATIVLEQFKEYKSNPSVRQLIELLTRLGFTLMEFGITPKGQKERELLEGHLISDADNRLTEEEYRKQQQGSISEILNAIENSKKLRSSDDRTKQILKDADDAEAHEIEEDDDVCPDPS